MKVLLSALLLGALFGPAWLGGGVASDGKCAAACDHKASDCVDGCDAKFPDDRPRVLCKVACADQRKVCAKACPEGAGQDR